MINTMLVKKIIMKSIYTNQQFKSKSHELLMGFISWNRVQLYQGLAYGSHYILGL